MSDDIIAVDSYDFDDRILHGLCLVFFYAEWCVQSRGMIPIMEEIADEYYDRLRIYALDVEQSPDVASIFAIDVTPAVIAFRDGKMGERVTGANPPSAYHELISEYCEN